MSDLFPAPPGIGRSMLARLWRVYPPQEGSVFDVLPPLSLYPHAQQHIDDWQEKALRVGRISDPDSESTKRVQIVA